jgi:hypothetical protein
MENLSLEQLKALAYDEGQKLEIARQNLQILHQEIFNRTKKAAEETKSETK